MGGKNADGDALAMSAARSFFGVALICCWNAWVNRGNTIVAPAAEQSAVGPFFDRRRPKCGSLLLGFVPPTKVSAGVGFLSSLFGRTLPPNPPRVALVLFARAR